MVKRKIKELKKSDKQIEKQQNKKEEIPIDGLLEFEDEEEGGSGTENGDSGVKIGDLNDENEFDDDDFDEFNGFSDQEDEESNEELNSRKNEESDEDDDDVDFEPNNEQFNDSESSVSEEQGSAEESDEESDGDSEEESSAEDNTDFLADLHRPIHIRSPSEHSDLNKNIKYELGADGKPREIRPEIIPVYDSDDTDAEETNTIGNVPLSAYDEFPHIGYDIDGKRIMRPATASALDSLLETIDVPEGWTGLIDKNTGTGLNLSAEELDLIKRLQRGENTNDDTNPYEDTIEWFSSQKSIMPLSSAPEPKRRFIPSKHEAKRIMKIVRAIREGRIVPNKTHQETAPQIYDIWADNAEQQPDHIMNLRAPKLPPPTHEESYNPPEEYLLDDKQREEWENTDPADRERDFIPKKYSALRTVPGYSESVRERFERSLDLYLAPRIRRNKLNIDPESLVPDLPSPKDLRPFPIKCSTVYSGHKGKVRTVAVDPSGQFVATGGDDGTVRVWEMLTGRELWKASILKNDVYEDEIDEEDEEEMELRQSTKADNDHVENIAWNPQSGAGLLAVAAGNNVYFLAPPVFDIEIENKAYELVEAGWAYATGGNTASKTTMKDDDSDLDEEETNSFKKPNAAKWTKPSNRLQQDNVLAVIRCKRTIKHISWHRRGDYLVSVAPEAANSAVLIHQLSKHSSQAPFRKSKGIIQDAMFHPFRPHLYVATQRYIRVYDLAQQVLAKKLVPGARWLSSFDIHPRGDNVITGSYDMRVTWHDMDLSEKPYKTLRYHRRAVRDVAFHKGGLPLFCTASDEGNINVFHGSVYDDMMKNPLLVPLKILKGHKTMDNLGIMEVTWHPKEAWLFSAGSDGTARLWTT